MKNFSDFNLKDDVYKFIELNGFVSPTKIQEAVIFEALKGKGIVAISDTGTGKTHAFLIPIFNMIDTNINEVQAVITAPKRELALQIYNRAKLFNEVNSELRIRLVTGGIEKDKMVDSFKVQPHIVIGTPGRIKDMFLNENVLRVDKARIFVVDEADMTLEYGFLDTIDAICSRMGEDLQMMAFSATIPQGLKPFLKKYMENPQTIQIKEDKVFNPRIKHILIPCKHKSYSEKLIEILDGFMPYVCLIFANTREMATQIAQDLRNNDQRVVEIHGGLQARQRKQAMKQLANLDCSYVVCTDIAARGIDIEGITHVVSCGLPNDLEFYTHRSGRTGRAGKDGTCFLLYREEDDAAIRTLMKEGFKFEHQDIKDGKWRNLKPYGQTYRRKNDLREKEIAKTLYRKNEKVKPGYKKKRKMAVEKIKQQERRDHIRKQIKEQRKEYFKKRQIEKNKMKAK